MQDIALWHERDISHSSVERIVLPDSSMLAHYMLHRLRRLLEGLQVSSERMRANLMSSYGLVFSQPVLLALVQSGLSRDDAYRIVQEAAGVSWSQSRDFRTVLEEDERVRRLDPGILDDAFDLQRSIGRIGSVFEALDRVEV